MSQNTITDTLPLPNTALEALPELLSKSRVRRWMFEQIHGFQAACPHCGHDIEGRALHSFWAGKRVSCRACGSFYTAATGTVLSRSRICEEQLFLLLVCMALDIDHKKTGAIIGVTHRGARDLRTKIEKKVFCMGTFF